MLSRLLRLGSGSTVGGRVGLLLDPVLLADLAAGRSVALVSGTNGKTTTTRLLAEACGGPGAVATSLAGANMPAGLVAALAAAPGPQSPAVLEVDEAYLGAVDAAVGARVVVVLNLSRDQLDRVGEVRNVASRWRGDFGATAATVVANCDDPLVVWAASTAPRVVWVAAGATWRGDSHHCPACGARIDDAASAGEVPRLPGGGAAGPDRLPWGPDGLPWGQDGGWSCGCGFARPRPDAWLLHGALVVGNRSWPVELALPGRFNASNAAMAAVAASVLGVDTGEALAAMARVDDVAGRFARRVIGGVTTRLLLAKNPAGWTELVELLAQGSGPVVVAVNARSADGHDPSWLGDVPFERIAHRSVVGTGERRFDLAVRLRHARVAHRTVADQLRAIREASAGEPRGTVDYVGNYTAFQELRRGIAGRAPGPWRAAGRGGPDSPGDPAGPGPDPRVPEPAPNGRARRDPLRIVVVHPDLLGTYGDAGNALVLANRARWRGVPAEILFATSDVALPETADLYCLGGGEDGPQSLSADELGDGALARALARGATVLAVCAGFQILGRTFPGAGGAPHAGLDLLDVTTVRGPGKRAVGEVLADVVPDRAPSGGAAGVAARAGARTVLGAVERLTGFANHGGATRLGSDATPLARVLAGPGNDGSGAGALDGAVAGRVVATYLHGPVLARNPSLADALLRLATGATLDPLDDTEEQALRSDRLGSATRPRAGRIRSSRARTRRIG